VSGLPDPAPTRCPRILIVEGRDDEAVVKALLRRSEMAGPPVEVLRAEGRDNIRREIGDLVRDPQLQALAVAGDTIRIGVIRDADDNPAGALQSVQDALSHAHLPVPRQVGEFAAGAVHMGTIHWPAALAGVLIVPAADRAGALEDLLMDAARADPGLAGTCECIDAYLACIAQRVGTPVADRDRAKAEAVAFLASREHPQGHVGVCAERGDWPLDSPVLEPLRAFLRQLGADTAHDPQP
jgi:hypothetical protein